MEASRDATIHNRRVGSVEWLLAKLHGGAIGTVVSVVPHKDGVTALDEYKIVFEDSRQLRLWSFQLTPAGIYQRRVAIDY